MTTLRVNEVFVSIQGEGYWTGMPVVFLRLQGCNLNCPWCDTKHSLDKKGGAVLPLDQVLADIDDYHPDIVVVTGGEPLLQVDALCELVAKDKGAHIWYLETNGTLPIPPGVFRWVTVSPKQPDYKVVTDKWSDINELKFVVTSISDALTAYSLTQREEWKDTNTVFSLQPVDNDPDMVQICCGFLTEYPYSNRWRLSIQIHKLIGVR